MKKAKRICAVLTAAALCVMGCMTAFADDVIISGAAGEKATAEAAQTQVADYKPATQTADDGSGVMITSDAGAKAAGAASQTQVADYKPAAQTGENGVIASGDAIQRAAEQANAAQVSSTGVVTQTLDFPNAAGQTVLHLSYGMLTVSEDASAALRAAVAQWNLQNAASLASTAMGLVSDATTVNALNGSVYSINQTITIGLNNSQYFSFLVTTSQDTGGAHANTTSQGVTMDAATGRTLSWSDMTPYLSDFRTLVISEIEGSLSMTYGDNLFSTANATVESLVNSGTITWYMTSSGMNFVLDPYSVLPYSYGSVTESIANLILQGYGIVQ